MNSVTCTNSAWGQPGMTPRWTRGSKDGVGCAYAASSRVWFTLAQGVVTEIYHPTIDRPQVRDWQFLITDGQSFFHEERRDLQGTTELLEPGALAYAVTKWDPRGRYRIEKEIFCHPHLDCVLLRARLVSAQAGQALRLYSLCAPHLESGGWNNEGAVWNWAGRRILIAHKGGTWLALAADVPWRDASCGYVGVNDGWTDLHGNFQLDWHFDCAGPGNIALIGELALPETTEARLALGFGATPHSAINTVLQALSRPWDEAREIALLQWRQAMAPAQPMVPDHAKPAPARGARPDPEVAKVCGDGGRLYRASLSLLLSHEDKTYPGAMIASMSIPWGEVKGDDELGGYHLVWTRDMVQSATGLLTAGLAPASLRALVYLATAQREHGGFYQNFWIDGTPYWRGLQLDEISFPIILAWRLRLAGQLADFDPWPLVMAAAGYICRHGPATAQERWEEASGYSPSTLAATIAGLICAGGFARERGETAIAQYVEEYADFLEAHLEAWTVTTQGALVPGIPRHFIRIHPMDLSQAQDDEDANHGTLRIANRPPGATYEFPAKDVVDGGFLELVRYGIRRAGDPLFEDSLRVVDAVLKVDTPQGPCWRRYNHDGYGQRTDGSAFQGWGRGGAWPLLTGERGHYELAAGRDASPYLRAMENFAHGVGLLPEQIWDLPDMPSKFLAFAGPAGSAMPLLWAHAEYVKLARAVSTGLVPDRLEIVAERYQRPHARSRLEIWKPHRQCMRAQAGGKVRVQLRAGFTLHWTLDEWHTVRDTSSTHVALGLDYVDVELPAAQRAPLRFTWRWASDQSWNGHDYVIEISPAAAG